jgi:hypothetical protein
LRLQPEGSCLIVVPQVGLVRKRGGRRLRGNGVEGKDKMEGNKEVTKRPKMLISTQDS